MIVIDLVCAQEHRFEGWFASHEAFEAQQEQGLVTCPLCNSAEVRRLPSAPHVAQRDEHVPEKSPGQTAGQTLPQLIEALRTIAATTEDVGSRFAEEARRIHYGDSEARTIKGMASIEETRALLDEGITVLPLPGTKEDLH